MAKKCSWAPLYAFLALFALVFVAGDASAEQPGPRTLPLYVLSLDGEDVEDQADALGAALRSRVRNANGYSLSETTVTLAMMTAAFKCQRLPDATCLAKIGDHLKAERFIWGTMQKIAGNNVKADVRIWIRGKPEVLVSETYTDNMKDQNDERLQRIAQRIFERLVGVTSTGAVVVRAANATGQVYVDGVRKGVLQNGEATLDLPLGTHVVEVRAQGYTSSKESVNVIAGAETRVTVSMTASAPPPAPPPPAKSGSSRKVGGYILAGVGGALLIGAGVELLMWKNLSDKQNDSKKNWGDNACTTTSTDPAVLAAAKDACDRSSQARTDSIIGWSLAGAGAVALGVGLYLVLTDGSKKESSPVKFEDRKASWRFAPLLSPTTQGALVEGAF